jgi:thiamine biosynthesis lipoprotein
MCGSIRPLKINYIRMNNKVLLILLTIILWTPGCRTRKVEFGRIAGRAQGTSYNIVYEDPAKFKPEILKNIADTIFNNFDKSVSSYNPSSVISKVNRNESLTVDTFFIGVFNKSKEISLLTDGAFDITVGPLVRAWGFGPDNNKKFNISKLDSLLRLVGFEKVSIRNDQVVKSYPGICLDVNAIAPGYSADVICRYFKDLGIKNFLVEVGGEVRAVGNKNGDYWKIGIDRPEDNNMIPGEKLQAIVRLKNKALATSGDYRKFYIEDGVKYSSHINPRTGYPAKNTLLSVSIIADECASADGIATAMMVMGKEKAIEFIGKHEDLQAYFIYSDEKGNFKTWISEKLRKDLSENPPE